MSDSSKEYYSPKCPRCGEKMNVKLHSYLATDPPSVMYECPKCGWLGSPWVSEKSIRDD